MNKVPFITILFIILCFIFFRVDPNILMLRNINFEFTQLLTYVLSHGSAVHILGCAILMLIFGSEVEKKIGHVNMVIAIILTSIFSGMLWSITYATFKPIGVIGSSGVVNTLIILYTLLHKNPIIFLFNIYPINRINILIFFFVGQLLFAFLYPLGQTSYIIHFGGICSAMFLYLIFRR